MPLYEFVLEIQNGDVCYEHKEIVAAATGELAMRFAREFAAHWRPGAQHDHKNDVYSAPEGWPQWTLARCTPVLPLSVPIVGKKRRALLALVPWEESFPLALHQAVKMMGALADPSLSGCSLKWILTDHLGLSDRQIADVVHAITVLQQSLPDDLPAEVPANGKGRA